MISLDPIKPYLSLIKLGLSVALLVSVFIAGCSHGEGRSAEDVAAKDSRIASLEHSLSDFVALYDRVNAQAAEAIAVADRQRKAADDAAKVARSGEAAAKKAADDFERQWARAKQKPDCAALLTIDMEAVCGLPLR